MGILTISEAFGEDIREIIFFKNKEKRVLYTVHEKDGIKIAKTEISVELKK